MALKKKIASLLLMLGVVTVAAGCGTDSSADKNDTKEENTQSGEKETTENSEDSEELETIRLGVMTGGVDQYIAIIGTEQGIFEKNGIQLETAEFAAGINTVDSIVTGQSDIGMIADFACVNRIGNTKDECNIRILGRYASATSYNLYVNPDQVSELKDLAGKGFASIPGTILEYYTALTYEEAGIETKDQVVVNVDSGQTALSALSSGEAAAFWTAGASAVKAEELGMEKIMNMEDIGLSVDGYYVSSAEYISEKEPAIEKFLTAVKETEEWIADNMTQAGEIVESKQGEAQEQVIQNIEDNSLCLDFKQDSVEHLNKIKQWAVESEIFEEDYNIEDYVDTTALSKLYPDDVD